MLLLPEHIKSSFSVGEYAERKEPLNVLLCNPAYYQVRGDYNPYMQKDEPVNISQARKQWQKLFTLYKELQDEHLIGEIRILPPMEGLDDMVFAANQSFPWRNRKGELMALMSRMKYGQRQKEVPYFEQFYREKEYKILRPNSGVVLEGMGDLIPVPGRDLVIGGYGQRSTLVGLEEAARLLDIDIVAVELVSEYFYHLDTCFLPVSDELAIICPNAFSEDSLICLQRVFKELIYVPEREAIQSFSLNAHLIPTDPKPIGIVPKNGESVVSYLESAGYKVYELDTSEFLKSGGSVACLKLMYY